MNFFSDIKQNYELLWKAIIRPPRVTYKIQDLGPTVFKKNGKKIKRTDIKMKNKRGFNLQCSHFEPVQRPCQQLPCVIYLHANSSCRLQSLKCISSILSNNVTLFTFDFAGCGLSEGQYISLGYYQRQDVKLVVDYLRQSKSVSTIGLWGRSMGAVTALMYADSDPSIGGLVLDSPFCNLQQLAKQLAQKYASNVPSFLLSGALKMITSTIKEKNNFDIAELDPLGRHVKKAFIPAFFVAGKQDDFTKPQLHTQPLFNAYAGDKKLLIVQGDHNAVRPGYALDSIAIFFYNTLQVEILVPNNIQQKKVQENKNQAPQLKQLIMPSVFEQHNYGFESQQDLELQLALKLSLEQSNKK